MNGPAQGRPKDRRDSTTVQSANCRDSPSFATNRELLLRVLRNMKQRRDPPFSY